MKAVREMNIDLTKVPIRNMKYQNTITIPKSFYQDTTVQDIKDVELSFEIHRDLNQDDILSLECTGNFVLQDARSLNNVLYPFHVEMEDKINEESEFLSEFLKNSKNTLDIMSILWENIVLEIPIAYTESDSLKNQGKKDEWEVVETKKDEKIDPRLAPLMELLDKEKE